MFVHECALKCVCTGLCACVGTCTCVHLYRGVCGELSFVYKN